MKPLGLHNEWKSVGRPGTTTTPLYKWYILYLFECMTFMKWNITGGWSLRRVRSLIVSDRATQNLKEMLWQKNLNLITMSKKGWSNQLYYTSLSAGDLPMNINQWPGFIRHHEVTNNMYNSLLRYGMKYIRLPIWRTELTINEFFNPFKTHWHQINYVYLFNFLQWDACVRNVSDVVLMPDETY